jgi:hypothetical protein
MKDYITLKDLFKHKLPVEKGIKTSYFGNSERGGVGAILCRIEIRRN